MIAQTAVY